MLENPFFRYVSCNIYLYFEISVYLYIKEIAAIFNVMNTRLLKVFFDVINRSDGLMDLIYELRIISIVFSALAIVFLSLVLFNFVIANYAQVARLCSTMKAILCKLFIHLYTYFILGLYLPACVNPMPQKKSYRRGKCPGHGLLGFIVCKISNASS